GPADRRITHGTSAQPSAPRTGRPSPNHSAAAPRPRAARIRAGSGRVGPAGAQAGGADRSTDRNEPGVRRVSHHGRAAEHDPYIRLTQEHMSMGQEVRYRVRGGRRLNGTAFIQGAKNAVLPMIGAALLAAKGRTVLRNVPTIEDVRRSEEHTSELQSREKIVCRLLHEKKKIR